MGLDQVEDERKGDQVDDGCDYRDEKLETECCECSDVLGDSLIWIVNLSSLQKLQCSIGHQFPRL